MILRALFFILVVTFSADLFATAQAPEKLIYKGKEYPLFVEPLNEYFKRHPEKWPRPTVVSTGLWRGYIATFEIRNNELFLKDIEVEAYTEENKYSTNSILSEFLAGKPELKIDWFSGLLIIADGKMIEYVHMGFGSIYENYILIEIKNGNFVKETRMNHIEYKQFQDKQFEEYKKTQEYKERENVLNEKIGDKLGEKGKENLIRNFENNYTTIPPEK